MNPPVPVKRQESSLQRRWTSYVLWMVCGGAVGGIVGTLLAHTVVILLHYLLHGNVSLWLKGPHGPPFFDLSFSTALYYACLGAGLYVVPKRLAAENVEELALSALLRPWDWECFRGATIGFAVVFSVMAVPMAAATRIFSWGESSTAPQTLAWFYLVLGIYALANGAAASAIGFFLTDWASGREALGALLGILGAYLLQLAFRFIFPGLGAGPEIISWLAPPSAVYSGVLWGVMLGLGIALFKRVDGHSPVVVEQEIG